MTNKNINIQCEGGMFNCTFRKSKKARSVRLAVYCDGRVVATLPSGFSLKDARDFVSEKSSWVTRKLEEFRTKNTSLLFHRDRNEYFSLKEKARIIVMQKIHHYNRFYQHHFNRVCIKDQRTRWGSCSSEGNLNFNYKIALLSERYQDYLVVHELCHLKEMNHSRRFWSLMEQAIPDARRMAKEIRKM